MQLSEADRTTRLPSGSTPEQARTGCERLFLPEERQMTCRTTQPPAGRRVTRNPYLALCFDHKQSVQLVECGS